MVSNGMLFITSFMDISPFVQNTTGELAYTCLDIP
jgi:hypothetical protein